MPFLQKVKFLDRVEKHGCLLHFLTVWNSWLRQQISKIPSLYKVSWSFRWNDEGKQAVKTKAERFIRRDDYFYFHHYSFQICITDQAWGQYDWIYDQIPFLHFARLCRPHALKLALLTFKNYVRTYEWSTCSKSSILFSFARNPTSN